MSGVGPPFLKMCLSCFFFVVVETRIRVCVFWTYISFHILTEKMNDKRSDDRNLVSFLFFFFKEAFSRLKLQLEKIKLTFTKT